MMATSMSACSVVQAFKEYQAGTTNKYAMDEGGNYENPSYYTWGSSGRITSYNVCYTKLLRQSFILFNKSILWLF